MSYQKQAWRDYDDTKTELQNLQNGAVVTPERMNHIETGIANSAERAELEQTKQEVTAQLEQTDNLITTHLSENVYVHNILSYGASTENTAEENTTAIHNAIAEMDEGDKLLIPSGNYNVNHITLDMPDNCSLDCFGTLITTEGVQIGSLTTTRKYTVTGLKVVTPTPVNWDNNIGVLLINLYSSYIDIRDVIGFENNIVCQGINSQGFATNEIHLGRVRNAKTSLRLTANTGGWCNENTVYGGAFMFGSEIEDTSECVHLTVDHNSEHSLNNNHFIRPSFEANISGILAMDLNGRESSVFMPRFEKANNIRFNATSNYWKIISTYLTLADNIEDNGYTNSYDYAWGSIKKGDTEDTAPFQYSNRTRGKVLSVYNFDHSQETFYVDSAGRPHSTVYGVTIGGSFYSPEGVEDAVKGSIVGRTQPGRVPLYVKYSEKGEMDGWKEVQINLSGTTRPLEVSIGYMFFDTTLNKPIWKAETGWADATGATV